MATSQITPIQCPVCGAQFSAPVQSIIDVGRDPQLKAQFLQGNINVAQCPQCGTQAPMTAPLLYHDPANELALVLMPNELNLHHDDQQKIIGSLTNTLINSLTPEQRKAYLLTPKTFFTMQSLVNVVLETEGITPEMLERQKDKARLINEFLQAVEIKLCNLNDFAVHGFALGWSMLSGDSLSAARAVLLTNPLPTSGWQGVQSDTCYEVAITRSRERCPAPARPQPPG